MKGSATQQRQDPGHDRELDPGRAARKPSIQDAGGPEAALLALQRSAGNRATAAALRRQAVQRAPTTTPAPPGSPPAKKGAEWDVEGGVEKSGGLADFAGGQVGQFGSATQFTATDVNLQGGVTKHDLAYKYGTTTTEGTQATQAATGLSGLAALGGTVLSSIQAGNARKEYNEEVAAGQGSGAKARGALRDWKTQTANALQSAGNVASNTFSTAGQIVGAGSSVMGDAASITSGALGAVASFIALPIQAIVVGRTIRKAAKQYKRVSELQKIVSDPSVEASKAKEAWQAKQDLVAALGLQKDDLQADLDDLDAAEKGLMGRMSKGLSASKLSAIGDKLHAAIAERAAATRALRALEASITAEQAELAKLDQAKKDAEQAIKDAAERAKQGKETPDDIAVYAMKKNKAGFFKKIVGVVGGVLGIGGGVAATVAAISLIGATAAVGTAALATPVGWALCGAAALVALGLGGYAFWKWASKRYGRAREMGMGKAKSFFTAINPFVKVGTSRREQLAKKLWEFAANGTPAEQSKAKETIKALGLDFDTLNMKDAKQKDSAIKLITAKMGS